MSKLFAFKLPLSLLSRIKKAAKAKKKKTGRFVSSSEIVRDILEKCLP